MATPSYKNIARAIYLSMKGGTSARDVVEFLAKKRLLHKKKAILESLREIADEEQGVMRARVWARGKLKENAKREISDFLKDRFKKNKIEIEEKEDQSLIAGYKIEAKDELIDLTIDNRVQKLKEHIIKAI